MNEREKRTLIAAEDIGYDDAVSPLEDMFAVFGTPAEQTAHAREWARTRAIAKALFGSLP